MVCGGPLRCGNGTLPLGRSEIVEDLGGSLKGNIEADLVKIFGYTDAFQDTMRWWNNANAITALIDYMLVTNDREYLPAVENTFAKGPNAFTISVNGAEVAAATGAAEGAAAGAAVGRSIGGTAGGGCWGGCRRRGWLIRRRRPRGGDYRQDLLQRFLEFILRWIRAGGRWPGSKPTI